MLESLPFESRTDALAGVPRPSHARALRGRFEVDACNYTAPSVSAPNVVPKPGRPRNGSTDSGITIIPAGRLVPQTSLLELKTRSVLSNVNTRDFYPQLLFSQTPTVLLARHERGTFLSCEPLYLVDMVEEEEGAQRGLK